MTEPVTSEDWRDLGSAAELAKLDRQIVTEEGGGVSGERLHDRAGLGLRQRHPLGLSDRGATDCESAQFDQARRALVRPALRLAVG